MISTPVAAQFKVPKLAELTVSEISADSSGNGRYRIFYIGSKINFHESDIFRIYDYYCNCQRTNYIYMQ